MDLLRRTATRAALAPLGYLPAALRERLSVPKRTYEGDVLDDDVRLLLGLERRLARVPYADLGAVKARENYQEFGPLLVADAPAMESIEDRMIAGGDGPIPMRVYRPKGLGREAPALVYFHGGGFVLGDLETYDGVCKLFAARAQCVVLSVDYRLAPEHPWPAGPRDARAAFCAVLDAAAALGLNRARVAVGGDSAGATLSALTSLALRNTPYVPVLQLLVYPATDLTMQQPSIDGLAEGLVLDRATMKWFMEQYLPSDCDRTDPAVSPLYASLEGVCPAHVQTAGFDPLRDDGLEYVKKLRRAGAQVEHVHLGSLVHGYLNMGRMVPASFEGYDRAVRALRRAFES
ncbi:MAG: alpha/beta hydrolase [Deltaproteobacteria bacterium]|nr:alpha/beta hydrolase [Deltaproteobacteria bacterium]